MLLLTGWPSLRFRICAHSHSHTWTLTKRNTGAWTYSRGDTHISSGAVVTARGRLMVRWTQSEPAPNINNISPSSLCSPLSPSSYIHSLFLFFFLSSPSSFILPSSPHSFMWAALDSSVSMLGILHLTIPAHKRSPGNTWGHALKLKYTATLTQSLQGELFLAKCVFYRSSLVVLKALESKSPKNTIRAHNATSITNNLPPSLVYSYLYQRIHPFPLFIAVGLYLRSPY